MTGVVASDYEGVEEVTECEGGERRDEEDDTWRKERHQGEGRKTGDNGLAFGERLTWKGGDTWRAMSG
jgi:hypothetical protein